MNRAVVRLFVAALFLTAAFAQPRPSPRLTVKRADGTEALKLESLRGKVVVLTFIMTTCPHCQDLTQNALVPLWKEYGSRGVEFVECAIDSEGPKGVPAFIERYKVPFTVGWVAQSDVNNYTGRSVIDNRPFYVPHIVFIDRQGMIRAEYPGESNFAAQAPGKMREELDKLLAGKTPASRGAKSKKSK